MNTFGLARLSSSFVLPLAEAVEDRDAEVALLADLGFVLPPDVSLVGGLRGAFQAIADLAIGLADFDADAGDSSLELQVRMADAFRSGIGAVVDLAAVLDPAARSSTLVTATDVLQVVPRRLLDYLTIDFAQREFPLAYALLHTIGIIELREVQQEDDEHRVTFTERTVRWDRLGRAVSDPIGVLKETYGWDAATGVETASLFENLQELGAALGLRSDFRAVDERARAAFDAALGGDGQVPSPETTKVLDVPLLPVPQAAVGVEVYPVADATGRVDGFGIALYVDSQSPTTLTLTDWLSAEIQLAAFATGFGVVVRKGRDAKVLSALFESSPAAVLDNVSLDASVTFQYASPDSQSIVFFGRADGTRLEVASIKLVGALSKPAGGTLDIRSEIGLPKLTLTVKSDEGDGFLHSVLGDGFSAAVDLTIGFSIQRGLYVSGGSGFEYSTGLALQVGPLFIDRIALKVSSDGDQSVLATSVDAGLALGPIAAVVKDIGLQLRVDPSRPGILGNADLAVGFKPPSGLGVAVDARAVVGGGFLSFDFEKQEYSGVLELQIEDTIAVKAIGLLVTKLPDAARGYSLLVIITAEGFQPIPLGLGFNLTGIGGLLAINRTFDEDALRAGLRNHTLDSVMFPHDPIRNAPQILSNLNRVFPPAPGHHLFGPVAQITWGTPALITANLALVLEIGARLRLLILAQVAAVLPSPTQDLIRLQMDAVGVIDFDQGTAALDATLHDSRLLRKFPLTGDMALRLSWETNPAFALAVGGLHPAFQPPPGFPKLARIALSLGTGDNPRLRCEAYFAITANTVQFGAHAELSASAAGFTLQGQAGFDVLIQLAPFAFLAEFYAQLQLKRGSTNLFKVRVEGALAGPRPLHLKAKATFEILWWDVTVRVDATLVDGERPPLPAPVDVFALLSDALNSASNWTSQLPTGQRQVVTFRAATAAAADTLLHPLGTLAIKQTVVPLDLDISRFGATPPAGARRFSITSVVLGGHAQTAQPLRDFFAPAQFIEMTDGEKLARPSFESMTGGVSVGSALFAITPNAADCLEVPAIEFETLIVDPNGDTRSSPPPGQAPRYRLTPILLGTQARFGAAAASALRRTGKARYRSTADKYQVARDGWSVATTDDLAVQTAPTSYSEAVEALTTLTQQQPAKARALTILRRSELSLA